MTKRHLARNTLIPGVLDLAEHCGVGRNEILGEIGLDPALAQRVGSLVPSEAIIDAVEVAALRTGRNDFGLLLGMRQDHRMLGPVGLLLEQASSIPELQVFSNRFFHLHNTALRYNLTRKRNHGVVELQIKAQGRYEPCHYVDALFVICIGMAKVILGPKWKPVAVHFRHDRLASRAAYQRHFGSGVTFNQHMNAMVCSAADLERSAVPRDPALKVKLEAVLQGLDNQYGHDMASKVSHIIRAFLPAWQASIGQVAKVMSMTPRTLQRRLRALDLSFADVLTSTRIDLARQYLNSGGLTVTQLAPILGLSEASAVCRFLRQAGLSADDLRAPMRPEAAESTTIVTKPRPTRRWPDEKFSR